jgi:hypothetical protein
VTRSIPHRRRATRATLAVLASIAAAIALDGCGDAASPPTLDTRDALVSLLATGDVGRTSPASLLLEGQLAVARGMTSQARKHPVDGLVLLGDNFYWYGLERHDLVDRVRDNQALPYCHFSELEGSRSKELFPVCGDRGLAASVTRARANPQRIFAVFGNHDLHAPESVELQRTAIPEFISNWTMARGGVEVFEFDPGVSLILFESEIHLLESSFASELESAIERSRGPWRIIAAHRPICMGERGDPVVGGYPDEIQQIIGRTGKPVHAFLSGHEHSLQLFASESQSPALHAIAGSGARFLPLIGPELPNREYAAAQLGFVRIDLLAADRAGSSRREERLRVSLFSTPSLPWIAWRAPRLEAQWSTTLDGNVRNELDAAHP